MKEQYSKELPKVSLNRSVQEMVCLDFCWKCLCVPKSTLTFLAAFFLSEIAQ